MVLTGPSMPRRSLGHPWPWGHRTSSPGRRAGARGSAAPCPRRRKSTHSDPPRRRPPYPPLDLDGGEPARRAECLLRAAAGLPDADAVRAGDPREPEVSCAGAAIRLAPASAPVWRRSVERLKVGLVVNLDKDRAAPLAARLVAWLSAQGVEPLVTGDVATAIGWRGPVRTAAQLEAEASFFVVLGGDGTLLAAAKRVLDRARPLLGVNVGHLGFLTEVEEPELFTALPEFLAGDYVLDRRRLVGARVVRPDGGTQDFLALNDVVVTKGPFSRVIRLRVLVDGHLLSSFAGDGLIVSSPTGSTAYSLSAGGPVLHPSLDAMIVAPICPHTFYSRPTVLAGDSHLRIEVLAAGAEVALTLDGQQGRRLEDGETLELRLAPRPALLMRRRGWSFYDVLRRKLAEGDREGAEWS
jgi:NAD+ kinase